MTDPTQAHSAVAPASPQARSIDGLWDAMFYTALAVFVMVAGSLLLAAFRKGPSSTPAGMRRAVVTATGVTIAILFGFLVVDVSTARVLASSPERAVSIRVTAHQWWWEVEYPDSIPQNQVLTANEIHLPVGRPVTVELRSDDVIHSFWPPSISGKRDLIPGKRNALSFRADRAGVYRGFCAEYCGAQHAKMEFLMVAEPGDSFASWLEAQRDTAVTPVDSAAARGKAVFLSRSCAMCHAISGTPAGSRVGPDLTHVASRKTLAAGSLDNTPAHLTRWIRDPQAIKPGSKMPPSDLTPEDLAAVVAYLETLQ